MKKGGKALKPVDKQKNGKKPKRYPNGLHEKKVGRRKFGGGKNNG